MGAVLQRIRWASLAQDLAIMSVPGSPIKDIKQILEVYNIDISTIKSLLDDRDFQKMLDAEETRFKAQGPTAGVKYKFGALSQSLAEKLYNDAHNNKMDGKDSVKLLDLLLKASGLSEDKPAAVNTQVNVGVQLPLPQSLRSTKLKHAFPIEDVTTVEVTHNDD